MKQRSNGDVKASKNGSSKGKPAKMDEHKESHASDADELERVRELLFGQDRQVADQRFEYLEAKLEAEASRLTAEGVSRVELLENSLNTHVARIKELREQDQNQVAENERQARRQTELLHEHIDGLAKGLRKELTEQIATLRKEITTQFKELEKTLKSELEQLDKAAAKRTDLASLFTEVADKLTR